MENEEVLDTQDEIQQDVEPVEQSMDDTIRQTLADIESRGETDEQRADRKRDEQGRFAKNAATEQTPESVPPSDQAPPESVAAPTVPPELQRLGLRKEEAEAIAKDPVALQAFIRRSEEMHKGIEQYREKANFGHTIEQAVAPFAATLRSLNIPPEKAISELLATDHRLRYGSQQEKYQAYAQLGQFYGLDPSSIPQQQQQYVDPQVQMLERRLQQQEQWINQQNQAREWQERETLNSEIARFSSDPSHTYFEEVRGDMAGLLQAGLASSLDEAYERAIYANPNVRSRVLAEQQTKADEQRRAESAQKAQAAKQAAAVNVIRKGSLPAVKPVGSMDDTIRAEAQRLGVL